MGANMILLAIIILFFVFFALYKRKSIEKVFLLDSQGAAAAFRQELEHTGDELVGRLEERIQRLEYLLAEADVRIEQLEAQLGAAMRQQGQPVPQTDALATETPGAAVPQREEPALPTLPEGSAAKPGGLKEERRKTVLSMAEQGYTITEIAKATGAGKGEILLLLQLHRR